MGLKLLEINQLSDYWDGSYKAKIVPIGVYSYHITTYDKDYHFVIKIGNVNILKVSLLIEESVEVLPTYITAKYGEK